MNHKVPFLSLIIPCYNERKLLKKVLEEVIAYLKKQQYSWEIIIVDDGSSDNTADIATGFKNMGVNIPDFTCGFKGFQNQAGYNIFKRSLINRWAYDAEIVFLAKKLKYKIGQIPVSWIDRRESRVRLGSAIYTSFFDLFRIRFNDILRKYD